MSTAPRLLYAVLDWGLGHATRSVPVIRTLLEEGAEVYLASSGPQLAMLRNIFPELPWVTLPGYDIRYPSRNMAINIALQYPHILRTFYRERQIIRKVVREHDINLLISDCRFGCYHRAVPSIFVTHQVNIKADLSWQRRLSNSLYYRIVNRYDRCWIMDREAPDGWAGSLSYPPRHPASHYIGIQSQLHPEPDRQPPDEPYLLVLLSGPEPQRTYLEKKILRQLDNLTEKVILVQGLPKHKEMTPKQHNERVTVIPYLGGDQLAGYIQDAELLICRSGYSTMMDLACWGKKALLIPTPGQTEQLYLADYYAEKGWCAVQQQVTLDLAEGIRLARERDGMPAAPLGSAELKAAIHSVLQPQTASYKCPV